MSSHKPALVPDQLTKPVYGVPTDYATMVRVLHVSFREGNKVDEHFNVIRIGCVPCSTRNS